MTRITGTLHRISAVLLTIGVLLIGLVTAKPVRAQGFTIQQAMNYPFPYGLTAARHGQRIAWVFNLRGASNVWVADGPSFTARQVTHYVGDKGMPIASLRLTPDGQTAVYARGSELNGQGQVANPTSNVKRPEQQVWAADVTDGQLQMLGTMNCGFEGCEDIEISPDGQWAVWPGPQHELWLASISGKDPARPLAYIRGEDSVPRWSPDGKEIAFVSDRGTHSLIGIYRFGDQTLRWIASSVFHDMLPRWSPDGTKLAFIRMTGAEGGFFFGRLHPWTIWIWDSSSGKAGEIWQSTPDAKGSLPDEWEEDAFQFAGDDRVVFASQEDGWVHLYSIPAQGGAPLLLTPGNYSFQGPVSLSADQQTLLYSGNENDTDRRHIWRVSIMRAEPEALTTGDTIEWTPVQTGDGKFTVCMGSTATTPAMPYRVTAHGREVIAESAMPADYPSSQFVTPKQVIFKSADGLEIHGQLFIPRTATGQRPALVFMHGGPPRQMMLGFHPMDAYNYMYAANQYLASRGYVVLSVNYRLSIMYGLAFRQPAHAGPQGASEYQDIVAGAKYLQSLAFVDANKIGLWGGSYGGYLTAMGLARNSDIFKAGVDYAGVHDWTAFLGGRNGAGVSDEVRETAYNSSPVASIDQWTSPVLLIQADDDRNVPFAQTVDLVHLLRAHRLPYELIVFPDEIHDSLLWRTWVQVFAATGDFFDRVLVQGKTVRTVPPEQ